MALLSLSSDCARINIVNLHTLDLKILQFLKVKTLPVHPEYKFCALYDGNAEGLIVLLITKENYVMYSRSLCAILTALI